MLTPCSPWRMSTFCVFLTPRAGTVALGACGVVAFALLLVPHAAILDEHEFYVAEFVKTQRMNGREFFT